MIIIVNVLYCIAPKFVDLRHMSISWLQRSAFDGAWGVASDFEITSF